MIENLSNSKEEVACIEVEALVTTECGDEAKKYPSMTDNVEQEQFLKEVVLVAKTETDAQK